MALIIAAAQSASVPGDVSENIPRHLQLATIAADHGVQLLVFPELSLTGYEPSMARDNAISPHDPRLDPLKDLAQRAHMSIIVGAPILSSKQEAHIAH